MFIQTPFATVNDRHELCVDGVSVMDLSKKYGTPYILCQRDIYVHNLPY